MFNLGGSYFGPTVQFENPKKQAHIVMNVATRISTEDTQKK